MTPDEFRSCIHSREYPRLLLALLFALPLAIAALILFAASFGLILSWVLFFAFLVWFLFEITYAHFQANWIIVSEHNYPRLHALLLETKERIGVTQRVDIIVYQQGEFNAYFAMLFARRAIFLNSELLEQGVTDDELRWLIGRFVGQVRAKRRLGPLSWAIALTERLGVFNLFIYPYIRATAYTGDRVALASINGDISTAIAAFNKLIVGRLLGYSVNPAGIIIQYRNTKGSLFAFIARLASPLPHNIARYYDLIAFSQHRFPDQYLKFAAMNPGLQTAGSPQRLMYTAPQPSYAGQGLSSGTVGGMLFFGSVGVGVLALAIMSAMGGGGLNSLANLFNGGYGYRPSYEETYDPAAAPAEAPAAMPADEWATTPPPADAVAPPAEEEPNRLGSAYSTTP
ncbi:hypothetical protein [Terricaulis sp.]|uniref:hypothetical protein n=1 Tax=Terricaulis sp. TaxID=2768686 RepID=UPI0037837D36